MYRRQHVYSKIVLDSHICLPRDEVSDVESLKRAMTAKRKYEGAPIPLYKVDEHGVWFGVPRYAKNMDPDNVRIPYTELVDLRAMGHEIKFKTTVGFRPGQEKVLAEFKRLYEHGKTGFILEAVPGFGKTICCLKMLEIIRVSTLVVVPRSNLVHQWIDRIRRHTNLPKSKIGYVEGDNVSWRGKDIVVALVHSLSAGSQKAIRREFVKSFGCVVFDEVDRSVPPTTFAPVVQMFPAKFRIGASATLKRQDGLERVFQEHIGQCRLRGKDVNRMKPIVIIHNFPSSSGHVYQGSKKLNRRGMLLSKVAFNPARNMLIARYVKLIYNSGRRVLVLSDRILQLVILRKMLTKVHKIPLEDSGFFVRTLKFEDGRTRNVSKQERERVASTCNVILGSYGLFSIGSDIPNLAGLVYATPQAQIQQAKGRIERVCEGKKQPVIVDIVDTAYKDAMRWASARKRLYRMEGLKVRYR